MKLKCPECHTNYNINIKSEDLSEKGNKVFCQKCNHPFFIRKKKKEALKSLMADIKNKLDNWDKRISNKSLEENDQEEFNKQGEDILHEDKEILKDVTNQGQPPSTTEQPPTSTHTEGKPGKADQDEADKLFSKAETKESIESSTKEHSPEQDNTENKFETSDENDIDKIFEEALSEYSGASEVTDGTQKQASTPAEKTLPTSEVEKAPETSDQEDIDKLFADAVTQQLDETSINKPQEPKEESDAESGASEQEDIDKLIAETATQEPGETSIKELEEPSGESKTAPEATKQEDIEKLFEEAVGQQLDGTLEEGSKETSEIVEKAQEEGDSKNLSNESYTVESEKFQDDLENLLEGDEATISSEASEETSKKIEEPTISATEISDGTITEKNQEGPEPGTIDTSEQESVTTKADTDTEALPPEYAEEEALDEETKTYYGILTKSKKEYLEERFLFYKDLLIFFFTDRQKIFKIIIPAIVTVSVLSLSGFWYFNKFTSSNLKTVGVADKVSLENGKKVIESEQVKSASLKPQLFESKKPSAAKEKQPIKTIQKPIPGITLSKPEKKAMLINIGSIVPLTFSHDKIKVMSVNIKLIMDSQNAYNQVKKGFPAFQDRVESTIKKYFEGKFYKEVHFVQEKLRKELQKKLNQQIVGGKIKKVELEDFLIQ